jgi:hypothetical protein
LNTPESGTPLRHGNPQGQLIRRDGLPVLVMSLEQLSKVGHHHLARVIKAAAKDCLGRFVVVDKAPVTVNEKDSHAEMAGALPHEYKFDVLLSQYPTLVRLFYLNRGQRK